MTQVIRITLSLLIAAVTLTVSASSSEAQLFRRLRDNIRANNAPSGRPVVPQSQQRYNSPYQVAPRPQGQYGQPLTPYARLTPQQREAQEDTDSQTASRNDDKSDSTTGADSQQAQSDTPDTVNVRIVTYYDPRTGRTFQRRFVLPADPSDTQQKSQQKSVLQSDASLAENRRPARGGQETSTTSSTAAGGSTTTPNDVPRFTIPPIEPPASSTSIVAMSAQDADQMPALTGPPIVAPGQTSSSPGIDGTVVVDDQIRIDTAVAPASANAIEISNPQLSNTIDSQDNGVIYSVLEQDDETSIPAKPEIESDDFSDTDDVEAFFGG